MNFPLSPCVPENSVSRDRFSRPVPRQPAHLHTQVESGAYFRDSFHDDSIFPLLRHLAPRPNTNDDIEQSPAQGGITIESDLEQLDGDPVRPDSLPVRQRADGVCQLLQMPEGVLPVFLCSPRRRALFFRKKIPPGLTQR